MAEILFTLFINDVGYSMHFVLLIPDKELRRKTKHLIAEHLGDASTNLNDISDYSIVLEDDEAPMRKYPEHVFKLSYIKDCLDEGRILDVSKYLKGTSPKFVRDFDYMKIVYYRKYAWNKVPDKYLVKKKRKENEGLSEIESVCSMPPIQSDRRFSISQEYSKNKPMEDKQHDDRNSALSENSKTVSSMESEQLHTKNIDLKSGNVNENAISSVQSIESKQKKGVNNLQNDSSSSDDENDDCVASIKSSKESEKQKGVNNFQNDSSSSDDESDDCVASIKSSNESEKKKVISNRQNDSSSSDNESDDWVVSVESSKEPEKNTKFSYTKSEKESILRYIIENEEYNRLKGNTVWQQMENAKICEIRSWQSMKEHFRKVISKQLNMFSFLTEQQKRRLKWS